MTQDTQTRRHQGLIFARRLRQGDFLLNDAEFRFAAQCERMRVDRNNSTLSILLIRVRAARRGAAEAAFLARVLEGRLRVTDTPGQLADGRIAVLLPDTSAEGAWKVASDVSEVYPPGPERPECEVLVYPRTDRGDMEPDEELLPEDAGAEEDAGEMFFASAVPAWKRALDIAGAVVGLSLGAPVIALSALAIKASSPGPIFFRQEREGRGGKKFLIWKLRTMRLDAENQLQELRAQSDQDGPAFKMRRDPRTTAVGRLLRSTSLDELPQFFNVLRGEMSLVGPRPLPTLESRSCEKWQRRRLKVQPGMTCTWQVQARGAVRFDDWVRMDLRYADRGGFWSDVRLVAWTLPSLLLHRGMR